MQLSTEEAAGTAQKARLSDAIEQLGNILSNRSFHSRSHDEVLVKENKGPVTKKGYLLPEFSTDSIGEMLGGPLALGHNSTNKFDTVSRTRSRLQSLLEKYTDSDPRSDKDEDGFIVPPPVSPFLSYRNSTLLDTDTRLAKQFGKCRVWNYQDFLLRLQTFNSAVHWFGKPDFLSPIQCALHGWCNTEANTIRCFLCGEAFKHSSESIQADLQLSKSLLIDLHGRNCEWRKSWCRIYFANVPDFDSSIKLFEQISQNFIDLLQALEKFEIDIATLTPSKQAVKDPLHGKVHKKAAERTEVSDAVLSSEQIAEEILQSIVHDLSSASPSVDHGKIRTDLAQDFSKDSSTEGPDIIPVASPVEIESSASSSRHESDHEGRVSLHLNLSFLHTTREFSVVLDHIFPKNGEFLQKQLRLLFPSQGKLSALRSQYPEIYGSYLPVLIYYRNKQQSKQQYEFYLSKAVDMFCEFFRTYPLSTLDWIRFCILVTICGWQVEKEQKYPEPDGATSQTLKLSCQLCCQTVNLAEYCGFAASENRELDLLKEHRYYCPNVNQQYYYEDVNSQHQRGASDIEQRIRGWECRLEAFNDFLQEGLQDTAVTASSPQRSDSSLLTGTKRIFSATFPASHESPIKESNVEDAMRISVNKPVESITPENVYKKIRTVLHQALN